MGSQPDEGNTNIRGVVGGSIVFGLIALGVCLLGNGPTIAQADPGPTVVLGIDLDPSGNTATSLGTSDQCISVSSGADFDIDVFLDKVPSPHNLGGFEYRLDYDSTKLQVNAIDHGAGTSLIMSRAGSDIFGLGDCSPAGSPCPDTDGSLTVGVADPGGQGSAEGPGSLGVLGRYNLTVIGGAGSLTYLTLTDLGFAGYEPGVTPWTDEIDQVWDGNWSPPYGIIAIDTRCPEFTATPASTATVPAAATPAALTATVPAAATPVAVTPTVPATATPLAPPPTEGGGATPDLTSLPWIAGYTAGGAALILLLSALGLLWASRRRRV